MRHNKLVKYFILPLLLLGAAFLISMDLDAKNENALAAGILLLIIAAVLVFWRRKPYFEIKDGKFFMYGIFPTQIPFQNITEIRRITLEELGKGVRLIGVTGTYYGLYSYQSIGKVVMNCNDPAKMVLIKTGENQYIISPDDPQAFIKQLKGTK